MNNKLVNKSRKIKEKLDKKFANQENSEARQILEDALISKEIIKEFKVQEEKLQNNWVYVKTVERLERLKETLDNKSKELEELKADFRKFYEKTQPTQKTTQQLSTTKKHYTFDCDLNKIIISRLFDKCFKNSFICTESDIVNLFSENITTQIETKPGVKLISVVAFFSSLYNQRIIKSTQWANIIEKTELIIFNGKPITSNQIKSAKKQLKNSYKDIEYKDLIETTIK